MDRSGNGVSVTDFRRMQGEMRRMNETVDRVRRRVQVASKKEWTKKRIAGAILCGAAGAATAFFVGKKAPVVNHAAAGVTGARALEALGIHDARSMIGGAVTGLASRATQDSVPLVSIGLAGMGYGDLYLGLGEKVVEGVRNRRSKKAK